MIGITSLGCYLPRYRLTGELLAQSWGGSREGSRSLANYDEDSLTMAAEAALECLDGHDPLEIDRLYFASVSAPYLEHQNAAIIAAVADLRKEAMACDFAGSLRAGTMALRAAYDAVKAETAVNVMVCAADARMAPPGDPLERTVGDGAAAVLVGKENLLAEIKGFFSTSHAFLDYWRLAGDRFVQSGDQKFITDEGIMVHLPEIVAEITTAWDLARDEIAAVVYYSPDLRQRRALDKKLGFPGAAYLEDNPQAKIGDAGNAQVFLGLIAALERSRPGDKILLINFGSGADACLLEVTERIGEFQSSLRAQLAAGRPLSSYAKYLRFRGVVPGEEVNVWASFPVLWREEKENLRRLAKKCRSCGAVQYPVRYKCWKCGSEDMGRTRLSRRGRVFTFTLDSLPPNPDPPTPMLSVDLEGGGRLYTQMTDGEAKEVRIGMEVETVFRRLHQGGGFNNYFWKFRPLL